MHRPVPPRPLRPVLPLLGLALAGCAGIVELGGVRAGAREVGRATPLGVDSTPRRVVAPGRADAPRPAATPDERRVCRGARPAGWVAVAYVPGDDCPRGPDGATGTAAIVVPLAGRAPDAVLDVCADERIPRDWQVERRSVADPAGRCPGAGPDGASAVMRIRRVR